MNVNENYIKELRGYLPQDYVEVLDDPHVKEAIENKPIEILCFRILAALTRKERSIRDEKQVHDTGSSDLRGLAKRILDETTKYSEKMHMVRKKPGSLFYNPHAVFDDPRLYSIFYPDGQGDYGLLGSYRGPLEEACEQAEQIFQQVGECK